VTFVIRLPWPEADLWQNRKKHWAVGAKAVKSARRYAWAIAKEQKIPCLPNAILEFEFHPPTNRNRDIQNMPATQKAAIDGIADAMGCDDSGFRTRFPDRFNGVVAGGCVIVRIIPPVVEVEHRGVVS